MTSIRRNIFIVLVAAMFNISAWAADRGTADQAIAMVKKAVSYIKDNGKDKAFEAINNRDPKFSEGDLYIFVYDSKGVMQAIGNGNAKKMVGKSLIEMKDADGMFIVKQFIEVASTKGSGWVTYKWPNPKNGAIETKSSYVEKSGDFVVACGIYKE